MADTVMISTVGEYAVSAIALVDSINNLVLQLLTALATGGAVVAAQYLGRRDAESGIAAGKQLLYAVTGTMLVVMLAVVFLRFGILSLIYGRLDANVMEKAGTYFLVTALSYPFLGIYNACAALFRSMGNSRVSLYASFLMNVINISGNALLIYVYGWGVLGAATATLVSRIAAAVVMLILIKSRSNVIYLDHIFPLRFRFDLVKRILRVGIPSGVENGMFQVGKLFVASLVSTLGTAAIAANAICNSIWGVLIVPAAAVNLALITVVGQCMGAGESGQAAAYTKKLLGFSMLAVGLVGLPTLPFREAILTWFNLSPETMAYAEHLFLMMVITNFTMWPLAFGLPHALRAAGDVKYTMVVSVTSMWICRVGLSYVFVHGLGLGLYGAWYAMFIDWIVRISCFVTRFYKGRWRQKHVID